jgi:hypothetical protein
MPSARFLLLPTTTETASYTPACSPTLGTKLSQHDANRNLSTDATVRSSAAIMAGNGAVVGEGSAEVDLGTHLRNQGERYFNLVGCELVDSAGYVPPARDIMEAGRKGSTQIHLLFIFAFKRYGKEEQTQMFGKAKGSSHGNDELLPPAAQLQDLTPANSAETDSTETSCSPC